MAARAANQDMLDEYTARNNSALVELVETHGVEVKELPADVIAELRRLSVEVVEELANKDEQTRRIADSLKAFAEQSKTYHGISEEAYYNTRN